MDALVSRALMIRLSLQPSPDSETSAFSNIRAFSNRCAGLFPFRISASSCSRSSALNRTTYLFTEISFAAMIASVVPTVDESESSNPFNLVEAGDRHHLGSDEPIGPVQCAVTGLACRRIVPARLARQNRDGVGR